MNAQEIVGFENSINSFVTNLSEIESKNNPDLSYTISTFADNLRSEEDKTNRNLHYLDSVIPDLSIRLEEISTKHEILRKEGKERFNVFDCLTKHHLEQLHTNFIAYLLKVDETHDCGDVFLKEFIEVLKDENSQIRESIHDLSLNYAASKTYKQKFIGFKKSNPEIYGFIDIFIEIPTNNIRNPKINIAIENKVKAVEQEDQIKRYVQFCKDRFLHYNEKYLGLYLTLDGKQSLEAGDEKYFCISFQTTILNWIDRILDKIKNYQLVHSGIFFYNKMLESKILHLPSNEVVMDMKELLLKKENLILLKYGDEICETIKEINKQLRTDFFKMVYSELANQFRVVPVDGLIKQILVDQMWVNEFGGFIVDDEQLTYHINSTDKIIFAVSHEPDHGNDIIYGLVGIRTENGKNSLPVDLSNLSVVKSIDETLRRKFQYSYEQLDNYWIMWKYYYPLKNGVSFPSPSLNYDIATKSEEIVLDFVIEIKQYLEMWKETINEIKRL